MPATLNSVCHVALIGNPNTGKSTLFSALAGVHQHVANYPGVTVEKKTGHLEFAGQRFELIDLPGLYSLAPRARDEMVALDALLGRFHDLPPVDVVLCVVDATNLQRNLYLVSQVLDLGLPTVVAVNMLDVAERRGVEIDLAALEAALGVTVVGVQAHRRRGISELKAALLRTSQQPAAQCPSPLPAAFESEAAALGPALGEALHASLRGSIGPNGLARRLLLDSDGKLQHLLFGNGVTGGGVWGGRPADASPAKGAAHDDHAAPRDAADTDAADSADPPNGAPRVDGRDLFEQLSAARRRLRAQGLVAPQLETEARFAWVEQTLADAMKSRGTNRATLSDHIDRVLTHRVWGLVFFAFVMVAMFQAVFVWADPLTRLLDGAVGWLGDTVGGHLPPGALRSLLVDGVIGGLGTVLCFLPQILVLFLFIAVLEDCGYMSRAAYLMDRMMSRVGLSGKSFIPLLSCFACTVPGIMATRVIENERDRMTTILVSPLLTCAVRVQVYAMLIAAFIPHRTYLGGLLNLQGLTLLGLYLLGIVSAVVAAMVLKRTMFRGQSLTFLLELPSYKLPSPRVVGFRVAERGWVFVRSAGTLILAVSILVWASLYYPHNTPTVAPLQAEREALVAQLKALPAARLGDATQSGGAATADHRPSEAAAVPHQATANAAADGEELTAQIEALDRRIEGEYQRHSFLGRMGHWIEPAVRPLGWDWRIGCSVLASFPAREIVIATMGVMYNVDQTGATDEDELRLQGALRAARWDDTAQPVFTLPVALSLMVFFALCAQCAPTLAVIYRETNSWRWPIFTFTYMTALAYLGALVVYQVGAWWSLGP